MEQYTDRYQAGKILAKSLKQYENDKNAIVFALPRGGVPVAYEISQALQIPLDIFIVRKLGVPGHEELAMGAIAMDGSVFFNENIVRDLEISQSAIDRVIQLEKEELHRRNLLYRKKKPFPDLSGKTVILVDDGIATGATVHVAISALRKHKPRSIVLAVPVAASSTCDELEKVVDQLVCPLKSTHFYAVGAWYENFSQTSDEEVFQLLG